MHISRIPISWSFSISFSLILSLSTSSSPSSLTSSSSSSSCFTSFPLLPHTHTDHSYRLLTKLALTSQTAHGCVANFEHEYQSTPFTTLLVILTSMTALALKKKKEKKTHLAGLEPATFRLTAERANRLRHKCPTVREEILSVFITYVTFVSAQHVDGLCVYFPLSPSSSPPPLSLSLSLSLCMYASFHYQCIHNSLEKYNRLICSVAGQIIVYYFTVPPVLPFGS